MVRSSALLASLLCAGSAVAQSSDLQSLPTDPAPFRIVPAPVPPAGGATPPAQVKAPGRIDAPVARHEKSKTRGRARN